MVVALRSENLEQEDKNESIWTKLNKGATSLQMLYVLFALVVFSGAAIWLAARV